MNSLMNASERNYRWKIEQQVTKIERTKLNWEAAAELKKKRCENRPEIELNQIQPECSNEPEFFIVFTNRSRIGNRCKDNTNQRPTAEEKHRPAPVYPEGTHHD